MCDGLHALALTLDLIPDGLHLRWLRNRIDHHMREAPREARHIKRTTMQVALPEGAHTTHIRLEGDESDKMWNIILADHDMDYGGGTPTTQAVEPHALLAEVRASVDLAHLNRTREQVRAWVEATVDGDPALPRPHKLSGWETKVPI
jgi:hypothetical protein